MANDNSIPANDSNEGFSESWLTLREPADHAARNSRLTDELVQWSAKHKPLKIIELGAGTGSNLRYLVPKLGHKQQWLLVDNDAALLQHLPALLQAWSIQHNANISIVGDTLHIEHELFSAQVSTNVMNIATELDQLSLDDVNLITASALLDLSSQAWLDKLAQLTLNHHCACFYVINYNGTIQWQPSHTADTSITALLNQHQLGDKGFGPALGPGAGLHIAKTLEHAGRNVSIADSDWVLHQQSNELQQAIIDGWAPAAKDQDNTASTLIDDWHTARHQFIEDGTSKLTVGHTDILSLP